MSGSWWSANPANTNALIAASNAPGLDRKQFSAMTRLDHNRAREPARREDRLSLHRCAPDDHLGQPLRHSGTPDLSYCLVGDRPAQELVDAVWTRATFIPTVQQRGAAIIKGSRRVVGRVGRRRGDRPCARLDARLPRRRLGQHGDPRRRQLRDRGGVMYSYPVKTREGHYEIVQDRADRRVQSREDGRHRRRAPRGAGGECRNYCPVNGGFARRPILAR